MTRESAVIRARAKIEAEKLVAVARLVAKNTTTSSKSINLINARLDAHDVDIAVLKSKMNQIAYTAGATLIAVLSLIVALATHML